MNAHIIEACRIANAVPRLSEVDQMTSRLRALDYVRVIPVSPQTGKDFKGRGREVHGFLSGLTLGKVQASSFEVHVTPLEREDFGKAAAGEQQEADGSKHAWMRGAFLHALCQYEPQASKLVVG